MTLLSCSSSRPVILRLFGFVATLGVCVCLSAQNAPSANAAQSEDEPLPLSPFVVTAAEDEAYTAPRTLSATRVSTALNELPVTLNVVTEEFLKDLGASDVQDALRYQNVNTNTDNAFTSDVATGYVVRGFDARVLRNGFPAGGDFRPVSRLAVDRIEIVKGPASLLYGAMDPGGVVNVVSKRPNARRRTVIEGMVGEYDTFRGSIDTTGALTKDKRILYRVMGAHEEGEGVATAFNRERKELVGMLQFNFTPATELNVEYNDTRNYNEAPPNGPSLTQLLNNAQNGGRGAFVRYDLVWPWDINYRGPGNFSDGREKLFNAELRHRFSTHVNLRLAYTHRDSDYTRITRAGGNNTVGSRSLTDTLSVGSSGGDAVQADLALQNSWQFVDWTLVGGVSYDQLDNASVLKNSTSLIVFDPTNRSTWAQPVGPASAFTVNRADGRTSNENQAAYLTTQLAFFKRRLHFLGGMRYENAESDVDDFLLKQRQAFTVSQNSYQAGALAKVLPNVSAYTSWSQSFVPQNRLLRTAKPIDPATGQPVVGSVNGTYSAVPVEGEGTDVGLKSSWFGGTLDFSAAWFRIERANTIRGKQIRDNLGNVLDDFEVQGGLERSEGVEVGINGRFFKKALSLQVNYTHYLSAKLLTDTQNPANIGKRIDSTPDHRLDFFSRYTFQNGFMKGLFVGGGGTYTSEFYGHPAVAAQMSVISGYSQFNGLVGYAWKWGKANYTAQVNVTNIEDQRVILNRWSWSTPRTFRFTLRAAF